MSNEGNAASYILSSEANVYTVTANVSKLNGLSINVAGSSLTTSEMTNNTLAKIPVFKSGIWIFFNKLYLEDPRVLAESSKLIENCL